MVGQAGRGAKGVSALKGINKGSTNNVPTGIIKGAPYSKDYVNQKMETANTALGKTKVPVFYREKLATNSTDINTFRMETKPLSELKPQMFSVKGADGKSRGDGGKQLDDALSVKISGIEVIDGKVGGKIPIKDFQDIRQASLKPRLVSNYTYDLFSWTKIRSTLIKQ